MRVQAPPGQSQEEGQSFSAAFELLGNPTHGELRFFSPLGSTAAQIQWSPEGAVLTTRGEKRDFTDLTQLIRLVLGTDVPVSALFAWLAGHNVQIDGWQVDLSQQAQGKLLARRTDPTPTAELRILLDD